MSLSGHFLFACVGMKAIEKKDVEAANNNIRAMIISVACTSGMGKFWLCVFIGRIKGLRLEPERLLGLMMYAGDSEIFFTLFGGRSR